MVACKQLLTYRQATDELGREQVIDNIKERLKESSYLDNSTFCVIASTIFLEEGMYREALQLVVSTGSGSGSRKFREIITRNASLFKNKSSRFSNKSITKNARIRG